MYRRTLNNKSSIPNTHYSLQQDNLIHNFNQLNFNDPLRQDENVYDDDVYLGTRYNNNNYNNIDNRNLFYPNNNTSNVNNVGFENINYIHYMYPYGNLNNHNVTETINTPAYNLYQIDSHNNNNIHDLNVKYYSNHNKNYYDQNQKYNKKKSRNEGNQNNRFINNNNNNNLKRWDSHSTSDLPFTTKYLTSSERYFHDPIDIQLMKEQNNNKPFISVQLNTTYNNSNKYNNHNHNHNHNYSSNFKYKKNSNQKDNTQKNALLYSKEQLLIQAKNRNQEKLNQLYNLISKSYNNKRKDSQPLFYMAGLESLPIYSFDELITYKEVDTMLENVDEEKIQLSVDKHQNTGIQTGLEQYFKRFIKCNIQPVDDVVRVLDSTAALTITQNVFASINNTTSNNDHDTEADVNNGNSTQINDDEDEGGSNNESENGNKNKIKNKNNESNNYNPNTKKSVRNLVQTKTSILPFNKQFQQYSNDSFELSFDGKAMDRSDIFRMVDSFSIVFDNDRDPNTSNPNINNPNGSNSNTQPFNLSENILPEEMTNNLVY